MKRHRLMISMLLVVAMAAGAAAAADFALEDARAAYLEARRLRTMERLARLMLSERKVKEARELLQGDVERLTRPASRGPASAGDVRLLYLAGIVEEMSGVPERRDVLFEAARRLTPADELAHLLLARAFDDLHREDIVLASFEKVLELEPEGSVYDLEALESLAESAYTNRRYARAAELSERLLKALRRTTQVEVPEEMLNHFEYLGHVSRGFALLEEKRPDAWRGALESCERAWRLDPTRIDAAVLGERAAATCTDKARAKELETTWRGRSDRVAQALRRSITAEPREPQNYNALAWFLAELGRGHDEGIRAVMRALELRPGDPAFIDTLAELQFKKGDVDAAVATIRRVIDVCPFANDYYRHQLDRFEAARAKPKTAGVP